MGGRMDGKDCAVSNHDLNGKVLLTAPSDSETHPPRQQVNQFYTERGKGRKHDWLPAITATVPLQNVVVIGGGAFACEAMRSAVWNGAASVTMLTREKSK